jgi:hypothetical protein
MLFEILPRTFRKNCGAYFFYVCSDFSAGLSGLLAWWHFSVDAFLAWSFILSAMFGHMVTLSRAIVNQREKCYTKLTKHSSRCPIKFSHGFSLLYDLSKRI